MRLETAKAEAALAAEVTEARAVKTAVKMVVETAVKTVVKTAALYYAKVEVECNLSVSLAVAARAGAVPERPQPCRYAYS